MINSTTTDVLGANHLKRFGNTENLVVFETRLNGPARFYRIAARAVNP